MLPLTPTFISEGPGLRYITSTWWNTESTVPSFDKLYIYKYISSFYLLNFYCRKFLQKVNYSLGIQSTIFYDYHFLLRFTCLNSVCNTKSSIDETLAETISISPQLWWDIIALLSFICLLYDAINALNVMLYPPPILNKLSGLMMMSTFHVVSDKSTR